MTMLHTLFAMVLKFTQPREELFTERVELWFLMKDIEYGFATDVNVGIPKGGRESGPRMPVIMD
jgi:hypothetical protein